MQAIISLHPRIIKELPHGFYWEGETDHVTYKLASEFAESVKLTLGLCGTSFARPYARQLELFKD